MTHKIKMNYPKMRKMSRTFKQGVNTMEDTLKEMKAVANTLENGALLGRGGQAFAHAINGPLARSINKLTAKFKELDKDINLAVKDMKQADTESQRLF
jgi:WXG100 family type VII secretion target